MMHRKLLLSATALWLFAGTAFAADIRGVIAKVDLKQNELLVEALSRRARGLTFVFHLDDRTTVRLNGEPGKLADLAAGQRVRVDYDMLRDGQRVARSVRIRALNAAAASPADAPAPKDTSSKPDPNAVAGILRRVDYTEREIIVVASDAQKKEEKQHPFQVPENAKITKDGKPLKFDDLKEGQQVVVYAQVREGKKTATAIDVGAPAAKPKAVQGNSTRIERFRRILQMLDSFLQMAEEGMPEQRP